MDSKTFYNRKLVKLGRLHQFLKEADLELSGLVNFEENHGDAMYSLELSDLLGKRMDDLLHAVQGELDAVLVMVAVREDEREEG